MEHLLFVYGTLKHDFHNHHIIADQQFVGHGKTIADHWQMYSLGGFPGVSYGDKDIVGELWLVDDKVFQRCDMLEGHPHFYEREQVGVVDSDDNIHQAWMYVYQGDTSNLAKVEVGDVRRG